MTVQTCPACGSTQLASYPRSRRTQHLNFRCRACGLVGWAERDQAPPAPVGLDQISVEQRSQWIALKRTGETDRAWSGVLDRVEAMLGVAGGHSLYDIGAGDGHFLSVARGRGFAVGGNDLMQAAVEIARARHAIDLDLGDITTLDVGRRYDAVTLWCVLAHVPDPDSLLRGCLDLLEPGGVLYLQTPHRCLVDRLALGVLAASGGRESRWVDRRIAGHHWILHTPESMTRSLSRLGFVDVEIVPQARYSLQTLPYLQSLGLRGRAGEVAAGFADRVIDRGLAPRITLDAFARKPRKLR